MKIVINPRFSSFTILSEFTIVEFLATSTDSYLYLAFFVREFTKELKFSFLNFRRRKKTKSYSKPKQ